MGKRYYCDFCDRTLPYSVDARKKHNSGHQHKNARKLYYDAFKSAEQKYAEEIKKTKCKRFFSGQECAFGDMCNFSHTTESDLLKLKADAEVDQNADDDSVYDPQWEELKSSFEVQNYFSKAPIAPFHDFSTPALFSACESELPPSLKPIALEDLVNLEVYNHWG